AKKDKKGRSSPIFSTSSTGVVVKRPGFEPEVYVTPPAIARGARARYLPHPVHAGSHAVRHPEQRSAGRSRRRQGPRSAACSPSLRPACSAFTRRGYEAQLAYAYRIQNKKIRDIVLDFMLKPAATAFGQPATQSWLASPGSGWKSHQAYPGGLSIHNLEWVEVASAWVDTYEKVYGVKTAIS